jgi:hypothetical protein
VCVCVCVCVRVCVSLSSFVCKVCFCCCLVGILFSVFFWL